MKKLYLFCAVLVFALLTSACQFSTSFVVVNLSNSPLEVSYELKPSGMMPHENVRKPYFISLEEFNSSNFRWRELAPDKFVVDSQKGIVKAVIQPNEVLQIESEDMIDVDEKPLEHFDVKKLNLNGANGLVTYEGDKIFKQFKKEEKNWFSPGGTVYVIYYK